MIHETCVASAKIESSPLSDTFHEVKYTNEVKLIRSQAGSVESGDDSIFADRVTNN